MESITRCVKDIEAGQRRSLEAVIGHELQDNQQIVIRVLTPGVIPDQEARAQAISDLRALSEQGSRHRESLGLSDQEVDEALDEAMNHVRRRESR
jgi:hypothetical protein